MRTLFSLLLIFTIFAYGSVPSLAFGAREWKNESEGGVVIATGNSRAQSLSFKEKLSYHFTRNVLSFQGSFLQSKNLGVLNAKRWDSALRYERNLSRRFGLFVGQGVESDTFAGFQQRYNSDIGSRQEFYRREKAWNWVGELGYRFTRERRIDGDRISKNQVRVYTELERYWHEGASSKIWMEYLPNFSRSTDWSLNTELSSTASFTNIFSIKIAYLFRYDHLPAPSAVESGDSLFTTAFVAKF